MVEPKWQLPRPLRLAGRVLEVDAAWYRLSAFLVADRNLHLDAAGRSRGADGEQQEKRMHCSVGWSLDHHEDSGPNAPLCACATSRVRWPPALASQRLLENTD